MTINPDKILAIDDEPDTLSVLRDTLAEDGLDLRTVANMDEAVQALDEGDWAVVLIDQRLHGSLGSDEGLDLVTEVQRRSPGAKSIIMTGYASPETIERAFTSGVYDYVEKSRHFDLLLRAKVRNARELAREQRLAAIDARTAAASLRELWTRANAEPDRYRKGRLLEDLLELLLRQVPGFVVSARHHGVDEEFDLVVRNQSTDPFWSKEGQYFIVECKNWTSTVGPAELDRFVNKLERRFGRATLGLFVAANGFTSGFASTLATRRRENLLVVPIDRAALEAWVGAADHDQALKQLHQRTVEAADG